MKNRDFFLTTVESDDAGLGITEDARKTAVRPEAREGVKTCERGFGFHSSQTLLSITQTCQVFKERFPSGKGLKRPTLKPEDPKN